MDMDEVRASLERQLAERVTAMSWGTGDADHQVSFRTTCGREIRVSHLALGGGHRPAQRVSLDIGASSGADDGAWAGLTPVEARRLAMALLIQAAACDLFPPQA